MLSLEAFQAGLSWLTILNKRERYRPPLTLPMGRSECAESKQLSKDLKARGWRFVGSTTVYSFMQAAGLVNDHAAECHARAGSSGPSSR